MSNVQERTKVFISYSHKDGRYLSRLHVHLKPLERLGKLELWDDTKIAVGAKWREEIQSAIDSARVAILLVSADFLASSFIANHELPPLLLAARNKGLRVIQVHIAPSQFRETELAQFQSVMNPDKPLVSMRNPERELLWSKVAAEVNHAVSHVADQLPTSNGAHSGQEEEAEDGHYVYSAILDLLSKMSGEVTPNTEEKICVRSGFGDMDIMLRGFQPSSLYVLAGESSVGKTAFALSLVHNAALKFGHSVGFITLEMTGEQVISRLAAIEAGVGLNRLRTSTLSDDEWNRFGLSISTLAEAKIYINDESDSTWEGLAEALREMVNTHNCELIIVDYMQLLTTNYAGGTDSRRTELSHISRGMKALARELWIPMLVLSQVTIPVGRYNKVPTLTDLHEYGSLGNDADVVMLMYRDDLYDPDTERRNIADITLAKNRGGPTGKVSLYFSHHLVCLRDIELQLPSATFNDPPEHS